MSCPCRKYYSIYNRKTDEPVLIHATSREIREKMNIKPSNLSHYVEHTRKNLHVGRRYDVYVDDPEEDEDE